MAEEVTHLEEKIVEKAHCPFCKENLCREKGIYFFLKSPNGNHAITYLPKKLGDYTVPLGQYDKIQTGTSLIVKCPMCLAPLNKKNYCVLDKVKLVNDPHEDYMLKFLSEMGKHGTLLIEHGMIIGRWGEQSDAVEYNEHPANQLEQQ